MNYKNQNIHWRIVLNYGKFWTCWLFDSNTFSFWFCMNKFKIGHNFRHHTFFVQIEKKCPIWKVLNDFENPGKNYPSLLRHHRRCLNLGLPSEKESGSRSLMCCLLTYCGWKRILDLGVSKPIHTFGIQIFELIKCF